jgi:iron(III) transport system ATP-binding protein
MASVSVSYGDHLVLDQLELSLGDGSIGCLLGPSGCGKTTALRVVAGFVRPQAGLVRIGDQIVFAPGAWVEPEKRRVGIVFQDHALFPHLSVADNIAFGLRHGASTWPKAQCHERVKQLLDLVRLGSLGHRMPHELSGGQQQRVALARALAPNPHLLLLDEPFSNLDPELRETLAHELREVLKQAGTTALMVTHDQHEAFALADRVGVMERGKIVQWDTAYRLYHQPSSRNVADFVGQGSFIRARLVDEPLRLVTEFGDIHFPQVQDSLQAKEQADEQGWVDVLLRPDDLIHDDRSPLQAKVMRKAFRGAEFLYTVRMPSGVELQALVPSHHDHAIGEPIGVRLDLDHVVSFRPQR